MLIPAFEYLTEIEFEEWLLALDPSIGCIWWKCSFITPRMERVNEYLIFRMEVKELLK